MYWRRLGFMAGWAAVVAFFVCTAVIALLVAPNNGSDFGIYLSAAQALRHNPHATIYNIPTLSATYATYGGCVPLAGWGYVYQPLLALLLEPLTFLPCAWATSIWQALSVVAWGGCVAWFTWDAYLRAGRTRALIVALVMTLYLPIVNGVVLGQTHLILLAIIVGSFILVERGRPGLAGALLAFGVFLKYLPIVIIAYYTLRGNWRVTLGAILGGAIMGAFELIVVGPQLVVESLLSANSGLQLARPYAVASHVPFAPLIVDGAAVLFVAGVLAASLRAGAALRATPYTERLGESWALATMLLATPLLWWNYLTWLLPAFVVVLLAASDLPRGRSAWAACGLLAGAYALAQWPYVPALFLAVCALWLVSGALFLCRALSAGARPPIHASAFAAKT